MRPALNLDLPEPEWVTLLRAERCHLVPTSGLTGDRLATQSYDLVGVVSNALLAEAIQNGAPTVAYAQAGDPSDSLLL